jgi:diaminopimelate epimerase
MCDRHFGIGADGLIVVRPSNTADLFMDYYNSDGSVAEMCGNGIRCTAAFALDNGLTAISNQPCLSAGRHSAESRGQTSLEACPPMNIETRAGIKNIKVNQDSYSVDMGEPSFENKAIGFKADGEMWAYPLEIDGQTLKVYGASMGNPHCVIFTDNLEAKTVRDLGLLIENNPLFVNKINVEWVKVVSKESLAVEVWERGAGYTLACGTGACAAFAVANKLNYVKNKAIISLPGGEVEVELQGNSLFLKGKAELVFKGEIEKE